MTTKFLTNFIFSMLNSAASSRSGTRQVHAQILKIGFANDSRVSTRLLSMYADHRSFGDASLIINSMPEPDSVSFSTLINCFSRYNLFRSVLELFSKMVSKRLYPDCYVFPVAAKACASLSLLNASQQVHGLVFVLGCSSDTVVESSLIHMYVKCYRFNDASKVLDKMLDPDMVSVSSLMAGYARNGQLEEATGLLGKMDKLGLQPSIVSWNGLISGFNQSGLFQEAVQVFRDLHSQGFLPDGSSVSSVLASVGDMEHLNVGVQIHGYAVKQSLQLDDWVSSALIDMYGKCSCTPGMLQVFDEMCTIEVGSCNALITGLSRNGLVDDALATFSKAWDQGIELNVVSWTSIIASCSQNGRDIDALRIFREMQSYSTKPNHVTISSLLPACGNIAALMHGKATHCFSLRRGFVNHVHVGCALVDMYSNCGKIRESQLCFDAIPAKNLACWNAMIGGYATHGSSSKAMEMFDLLQKSGLGADGISFTCVLSACSQNGLTKEAWRYFHRMSNEHRMEAKMEHYACMVNLLGRAGKLEEAYSLVKRMPFEPDACTWGALLSSCRVHNNAKLGEIAAGKLIKLEPTNPGNYILLANIYASQGMWDRADRIRDSMKKMRLNKNPGYSWIEFKNEMHMLVAGDKSHPQMVQIIKKLEALKMEMRKSGLAPITNFVLQDVEEQDKEHILCGHSEKLAAVLGLLNTPPGSPLRIIKNLRICGDCHSVMKFISSSEKREIFVRDTNRFHHFQNGECSCGDYW